MQGDLNQACLRLSYRFQATTHPQIIYLRESIIDATLHFQLPFLFPSLYIIIYVVTGDHQRH